MKFNAPVIGLDVGEVRIGVAVSDSMGMIATGRGFLSGKKQDTAILEIIALIEETGSDTVVVGLPVNLKGEDTAQTTFTRAFAEKLRKALPEDGPEVVFYDERLTSAIAERALIESGVRRKKRKGLRDQVAAAVMLQGYLDQHAV